MLDASERAAEFPDHVIQLVVVRLGILRGLLGRLANIHIEEHHLGSHGAHLIAEAVSVDTRYMRRKCVFAAGLTLALVNYSAVGADDFHVNVKESALGDLKHQTCQK